MFTLRVSDAQQLRNSKGTSRAVARCSLKRRSVVNAGLARGCAFARTAYVAGRPNPGPHANELKSLAGLVGARRQGCFNLVAALRFSSTCEKTCAEDTFGVCSVFSAPLRERVRPAGGQGCFDLVDPGFQSRSADLLIRSSF